MNFVVLFVQPKNQQRSNNERQLDYNGFCDRSIPTSMPVALATVNEVGSRKAEVGSVKIAYCASASSRHCCASNISHVTSSFILHTSSFVYRAGIAALPIFRASLHPLYFTLPPSYGVESPRACHSIGTRRDELSTPHIWQKYVQRWPDTSR